jgi:hypothetical protein
MHISVTAEFENPLAANLDRVSFEPMSGGPLKEFTMYGGRVDVDVDDGGITLPPLTADALGSFVISTDSSGNIVEWDVAINRTVDSTQYILATHFFIQSGTSGYDFSVICASLDCSADAIDRGRIASTVHLARGASSPSRASVSSSAAG